MRGAQLFLVDLLISFLNSFICLTINVCFASTEVFILSLGGTKDLWFKILCILALKMKLTINQNDE